MRWAALVAVACGCNSIFGVEQTRLIDAPPEIDARPGAVCPSGDAVPVFRTELNLIDAPRAQNYGLSRDAAISAGIYVDESFNRHVGVGNIDAALERATVEGLPAGNILSVQVTPEGESLFVSLQPHTTYATELYELRRPDGIWKVTSMTDLSMAAVGSSTYYSAITPPTRGPDRRLLFPNFDPDNSYAITLYEMSNTGDAWKPIAKHPIIDFTVQSFDQPSLTPDGLHLVFASQIYQQYTDAGTYTPYMRSIYYASRPTLDAPFGMPRKMDTVPGEVQWPFLTEDCGRIYFSALNTVFYLPY